MPHVHVLANVATRVPLVRLLANVVPVLVVLAVAHPVRGEATEAQRALLKQSFDAVRAAGDAYRQGKFEAAGQELIVAMRTAGQGLQDADEETYEKAGSILSGIERAHATLQLEGIVLPPFERPVFGQPWHDYTSDDSAPGKITTDAAGARPARPTPRPRPNRNNTPPANTPPAMDGVSFANQVAPILVSKCGGCHIRGNRGNFSLASYDILMKGPPEGVVVFAGDPIGSRLIETIETGDMPRGGGKVSPAELKVLKDWVSEGAKFDGPATAAPLSSYASSSSPTPAAANNDRPMVATATGKETVSFAKDIAPLLVDNCSGCHLDAMQIRGGLNMNTLAQLMRGGDSGEVITAGQGDDSLLVRKLRGQEGARMPAGGRPPLSDDSIALVSKWIDEGAKLDAGGDEDQPLRVMVIETWAKNATHDELAQRRLKLARDNWKLGAAESARGSETEFENDDVFVIGLADEKQLKQVADAASAALKKAKTLVPPSRQRLDSGDAEFRGRVSIAVFPRRYDYGEYSKMVEGRDVPTSWDAHWRYDGVNAYISMVVGDGETNKELLPRLVAPMASLLVASRGESPRWFREGLGRAVAAKTVGRDLEAVREWEEAIPPALSVVKEPKDLVQQNLPPAETDILGYGLCKVMVDGRNRKPLDNLLSLLEGGNGFEESFQATYQVPLEQFVGQWILYAAQNRRR